MKKDSKDYFLKTFVAFVLIGLGAWGISIGYVILGVISFLIGFIIGLALYGQKWFWWW